MASKAAWIVMPFLGHETWEMTQAALEDCFAMSTEELSPQIVLIHNGITREDSGEWLAQIEEWCQHQSQILCLRHTEPQTVDAAWNEGLDLVFSLEADRALVVNNDVRLHRDTWRALSLILDEENALFVSGVGVREDDCLKSIEARIHHTVMDQDRPHGGPDFSCFMIRRACHEMLRFDPRLSYFGDNDYHRRMKLAGWGEKIFGVDVPFLHLGSQTINRTPETAREYVRIFESHREIYREKWGGDVRGETLEEPKWRV